MNIEQKLTAAIQEAVEKLYELKEEIILQPTRKEFEGNYTYVFFGIVSKARKAPTVIGEAIGEYLSQNSELIDSFNVVKGFLNLKVKDKFWVKSLQSYSPEKEPKNGETILVEFSSPNTNKPLHLGHLRNNFLGYSVSKILDHVGYNVIKASLVNDRGIHICKSMVAYMHFGEGETPETSGMKGDHLVGKYYVKFDQVHKSQIAELMEEGLAEEEANKTAPIMVEAQEMLLKWENNDPEIIKLWSKLNGWVYDGFDETYGQIGVSFDKVYYESDTYILGKEIVDEGLEKGIFFKKEDGSVWVDLTEEGLDEKLILRGDGTSVYITQDLGTTDLKFKDYPSKKSVWVVGNEQDYHFKVLFAIMAKLGRSYAEGCYHLSYGMVDLPSGKMKSREGTVVDADDLVSEMIDTAREISEEKGKTEGFDDQQLVNLHQMVALGALKYYLLKVEPKKRMLFNPEESIDFQGNTGPFIQYTHARIKSIIRRAEVSELVVPEDFETVNKEEVELVLLLNEFPKTVHSAAKDYSPALVANYIYELAKTFNTYYSMHSVLNEEETSVKIFRLMLINQIANTIKTGMDLLGVAVPEKM